MQRMRGKEARWEESKKERTCSRTHTHKITATHTVPMCLWRIGHKCHFLVSGKFLLWNASHSFTDHLGISVHPQHAPLSKVSRSHLSSETTPEDENRLAANPRTPTSNSKRPRVRLCDFILLTFLFCVLTCFSSSDLTALTTFLPVFVNRCLCTSPQFSGEFEIRHQANSVCNSAQFSFWQMSVSLMLSIWPEAPVAALESGENADRVIWVLHITNSLSLIKSSWQHLAGVSSQVGAEDIW